MLRYNGPAELIVGDSITKVVTALILEGDVTASGQWRARLLEVPGWLARGLARGEDTRSSLRFAGGRDVEFSTERYDLASSWLVVAAEGSLPPEQLGARVAPTRPRVIPEALPVGR